MLVVRPLAGYVPGVAEERWLSSSALITKKLIESVIKNPSDYQPLMKTLRPIRKRLLASLSATFRGERSSDTERSFATNILTDYASDQPAVLADLLMDAGPKEYSAFFPAVQNREADTVPLLQAEIGKRATHEWNDPPRDASGVELDSAAKSRIESAGGLIAERFAFCQKMPLFEFLTTAEEMRTSGYRPIRFRPYADGQAVRVAAVWKRDRRKWKIAHDQTSDQVRKPVDRNRNDGFVPVDVAGYVAILANGKSADRYAIVWAEKSGARRWRPDGRVDCGLRARERPRRFQERRDGTHGAQRFSRGRRADKLFWHLAQVGDVRFRPVFRHDLGRGKVSDELAQHAGITLVDLSVGGAAAPATTRDRASVALQTAEASLKAKPDDPAALFARASACLELGDYNKAIGDLDAVLKQAPQLANAVQLRSIARARLGQKAEARADLAQFQKSNSDQSTKLYLSVIVAAALGEGVDQAFAELEAALKSQPKDLNLAYNAAYAYALASQAIGGKNQTKRQPLAGRAIGLLKAAIASGYSDFKHMQEDADLDPIRSLAEFGEIMKAGHVDRRCQRCGPAMPVSRPIPSSVSIRTIISSAAASWSLRAIAWSRYPLPGLRLIGRRSPPRSGTARWSAKRRTIDWPSARPGPP